MNKQTAIIFDMGNVLFKVNTWGIVRELGIISLICYAFEKRTLFIFHHLISTLFNAMYHFGRQRPHNHLAATYEGYELPELMCQWQRGLIDSKTVLATLLPHLDTLYQDGTLSSAREYILIRRLATFMYTPALLAQYTTPFKQGWHFVQECKKRGYTVCILSNFDAETFAVLNAHYSHFFMLFDEIMISGTMGTIKPEYALYEHLLARLANKYAIDVQHCWFIDDTLNNIIAAERLGIKSILCESKQSFDRITATIFK